MQYWRTMDNPPRGTAPVTVCGFSPGEGNPIEVKRFLFCKVKRKWQPEHEEDRRIPFVGCCWNRIDISMDGIDARANSILDIVKEGADHAAVVAENIETENIEETRRAKWLVN